MTSRFDRMERFFADVRAWQAARRERRLEEMEAFLGTIGPRYRQALSDQRLAQSDHRSD